MRDLRLGERRHGHRRRLGQRGRADPVLHRRDPRQHRAAHRRRERPRRRDHGRVPLLRRPRPRLGLAGAAARTHPRAVPADVRDARRHPRARRRPRPPHRPADGDGRRRRAPRAVAPLLRGHAAARDDQRSTGRRSGAHLCRPLHPGRGTRTRPGAHQHQRRVTGGTRPHRRDDRRFPVHRRLRQGALAAGAARYRRAPRGHAAEVPAAGRAARAGRAAESHLRHRHARCRHQRADPHGGVRRTEQVRRRAAAKAAGARVPPDRRARRPRRLRHRRHGRGAGTRARGRERPAARPRRRRREEEAPHRPQEAAGRVRVLGQEHPRPAADRGTRGARAAVHGDPGDGAQRHRAPRRRVHRDEEADPRQPQRLRGQAGADPRGDPRLPGPARSRRHRAARRTRRHRAHRAAHRRPATEFRAQPAAVDVRARRAGASRPRLGLLRPRRRVGVRGDAGGPAPDPARPTAQGARRGGGGDEGRGHRLRRAHGVARRRHAPAPAGRAARRGVRHLPAEPPVAVRGPARPKSVVRDMWERAMTFTEYVSFYGLARSEGLVLRYLSDAYRTLRTSVPDTARIEALDDITEWLGALVRQVDSSLLDEWEQLTGAVSPEAAVEVTVPVSLTENVRAFTVLVRNAMFRRVELAALRRYDDLGELDASSGWTAERWRTAVEGYFAEYDRLPIDADARNPALLHVERTAAQWHVRQVFDDPEGDHDWAIRATVDLPASDEAGEPVVEVTEVGPFSS